MLVAYKYATGSEWVKNPLLHISVSGLYSKTVHDNEK